MSNQLHKNFVDEQAKLSLKSYVKINFNFSVVKLWEKSPAFTLELSLLDHSYLIKFF